MKNELNEKISSLLNISNDLIFILDSEGNFEYVNENGAKDIGYDKNELIKNHISNYISSSGLNDFSEVIKKITNNSDNIVFQTKFLAKNDDEVDFEISCRTIKDKDKLVNLIGFGKNITKSLADTKKIESLKDKLTEAERLIKIERERSDYNKSMLEELNNLKKHFMSNVSHEMRTPLASIIGFSETIDSENQMPKDMRDEFNKIILKEGKRLANLINGVLNLTRIESGDVELEIKKVDIILLLKNVVKHKKKDVKEKNIKITTNFIDKECMLLIDQEKIIKIINELLNNAIKFTNPNGRIYIMAQSLYNEFEIVITDTGIGISEDEKKNIFQKFYDIGKKNSNIQGLGLGLVFVKQIIELHKGYISVQSNEGKGTSFIIKLPLLHENIN